jgi:hypothetical protein
LVPLLTFLRHVIKTCQHLLSSEQYLANVCSFDNFNCVPIWRKYHFNVNVSILECYVLRNNRGTRVTSTTLQGCLIFFMVWKRHYQYESRSIMKHVPQTSCHKKLRRQEFCNSFTFPLQLRLQTSHG